MTSEQMAQTLEQMAEYARTSMVANRRLGLATGVLEHRVEACEAGAAALRRGTCDWRGDDDGVCHGSCGIAWVLTDGTPAENGMLFCPRCGRHLMSEQTTTPVSAGLPCNTGGEWWKAGDDS